MLIDLLDSLYKKLPKFSPEMRDFVVKILPILTLISGIFITLSSIIDLLGSPFLNAFTKNVELNLFQKLMIVNILGVLQGILMISSYKWLRKKKKSGWKLIFWSQILFIISAVITFSPSFLLGLIFLYPLFQVRANYR